MYANASEIFKLRVFSFALKFHTCMLLPLFLFVVAVYLFPCC